ncbi:MAG: hypothetical protein QOI54_3100 [Actinomycetota bacterium]|jgi:uncharacterized protein|nr:hypothetical protein [Actinomycetota bacterium]
MSRTGLRLLGGAAVVAVSIVGSTLPALAHVTVNPATATQGGFTKLSFRVPNETDNANTTKVEVLFPSDNPLGSVAIKPHPGWSFTTVKAKLAKPITTDDGQVTDYVSTITWTADSAASAIKPGEFDEFDVSAGPLPTAKSMTFKALQTYSDGQVVRWIELPSASGAEPEHPAPTLTLTPATAEGTDSAATGAAGTHTPAKKPAATTAQAADTASSSSVNLAIGLAIAALIVGLLAGAAGAAALRRRSASPVGAGRDMSRI